MDNFHHETVAHFRGVEMLSDDVTLVTFPKCGTTWTWKILHSLLRMDGEGNLPREGKFNREEDFQQCVLNVSTRGCSRARSMKPLPTVSLSFCACVCVCVCARARE